MPEILLHLLQSILFFLIFFTIFYKYANKLSLIDYPDAIRKKHLRPVPSIGGLIIYFSVFSIALINNTNFILSLIIFSSLFVVIVSSLDDSMNIGIFPRLLSQIFVSMIIIGFNLQITYIGTYPYFGDIDIGNFSILFTLFCVLLATNAYNFIDGADGVTGTQFIVSFVILFIYLFIENKSFLNLSDIKILYSLFFLVTIFLFFNLGNFNNKKIFLGDSGSNFLGFILAWILIYFSSLDLINPLMCIWVVALPCIDLLRVFINRIFNKTSPLSPDRTHIHFLLIEKNYSSYLICVILSLISLLFGVIGYLSISFGSDFASLVCFLLVFIAYYFFVEKFLRH